MLTRTLVASTLPRRGRLRPARPVRPSLRTLLERVAVARQRSLLVQERVDAVRARSTERHNPGRRP